MQEIDFILYLISMFFGGTGAWIIAKWGLKLSLLDKPNSRSSHEGTVPKGGGIGILAAFFVCSIVFSIPKSFWIPSVFLSLLSLWGDRSEIRPKIRLLFQLAAGTVLLIGILMGKGSGIAAYALIPLLAIFVVGTANYYNFMDGINGIAGITGLVGFGLLGWFGGAWGADPRIITLCVCMSIACLGFLPFNVPKARVPFPVDSDRVRKLSRPLTFSCEKAKSMLGYEPVETLEEGLRREMECLYPKTRSTDYAD